MSATRPVQPCLVRGAQASPVITVEVLVEQQVVLPVRIVLHALDPAEAGSPPIGADQEDRNQPVLEVVDDCFESPLLARTGRVLNGELLAEKAAIAFEHTHQQIVETVQPAGDVVVNTAQHAVIATFNSPGQAEQAAN